MFESMSHYFQGKEIPGYQRFSTLFLETLCPAIFIYNLLQHTSL